MKKAVSSGHLAMTKNSLSVPSSIWRWRTRVNIRVRAHGSPPAVETGTAESDPSGAMLILLKSFSKNCGRNAALIDIDTPVRTF